MAHHGGRVVGDYVVGRQIGSGSFSVVWHGRHRVHGTEVAIKEIAMEKLNRKLRESLLSEIVILRRINHPNIVRLHDMIETSGRVHLVLEYCKGGDLSLYIQRHGAVAEATAKYFMQQLAVGLQVLRAHNLIHRDLKPQNLLLLTNDEQSILKIADFGFARSLQPRGLAETLCGSPLYMAPEIMQLQKYDAKADLWSVGAILYQLVTGKTPFTGNNQIQLLQNIMKSAEVRFPPGKSDLSFECLDLCQRLLRRNPVERLTFEEFFNHNFLLSNALDKSVRENGEASARISSVESNLVIQTNERLHEDCLPFIFDDDHHATDVEPFSSSASSTPFPRLTLKQDVGKVTSIASNCMNISYQEQNAQKGVKYNSRHDFHNSSEGPFRNAGTSVDPRQIKFSKGLDSLEWIDQDYVLVSSPPVEETSSSASATRPFHSVSKSGNLSRASFSNPKSSSPMPITGALPRRAYEFGSSGSNSSVPSGASLGSTEMGEILEQPSSDCISRIKSLQICASAVGELVCEKVESGRQLEAFSVQLVLLAIWKQALHICHTEAASAVEGSPLMNTCAARSIISSSGSRKLFDARDHHASNLEVQGSATILSRIEREFLQEVEHAEELATDLELSNGNAEMPDAVEIIFQSALALGRNGAVDELMGAMENAVALYTKAVRLLSFLLVEAPSLILNPPLSLTTSDRFRLRSYIDILNNRQSHSRTQRIALLKCEDPPNLSP